MGDISGIIRARVFRDKSEGGQCPPKNWNWLRAYRNSLKAYCKNWNWPRVYLGTGHERIYSILPVYNATVIAA
jgi:hypothetical protein